MELRAILGALVFGVDDETIEYAALHALEARGWTLGVAESLTAGLIGARIGAVPGASRTFRGSIASYATEVKQSVLGVTTDHVVSEQCAIEMAVGAQRVLGADVGIAATGRRRPRRAGRSAARHGVVRDRAAGTGAGGLHHSAARRP